MQDITPRFESVLNQPTPQLLLTKQEHTALLDFAHKAYFDYQEYVPGKSKSMQLIEIFNQCSQKFPAYAATAKMYVYFQLPYGERTLHESILINLDPEEFLNRCPDFAFTYDEELFQALRNGMNHLPPHAVEHAYRILLLSNQVPFISYLNRNLAYFPDLEQLSIDFDEFYAIFKKVIHLGGLNIINACIEWYHIDPNYEWADGSTLLSIATIRGNATLIRLLLSHHADPSRPIQCDNALQLAKLIARKQVSSLKPLPENDVEYIEQAEDTVHQYDKIIAIFDQKLTERVSSTPAPAHHEQRE